MGAPAYITDLIRKAKALPQTALDDATAPVDWLNGQVHRVTGGYLPGLHAAVTAVPAEPVSPPRDWQAFVAADAANRAVQNPTADNSTVASVRRKYPNILGR